MGNLCTDASWGTGLEAGDAVAQAGALTACLRGNKNEMNDFPLEQSHDKTLKNASDRVCTIDRQLLQPDQLLFYPYFSII